MTLQGKRILVTGGHGFLGSHLVEALIHSGSNVVALAKPGEDTWRLDSIGVNIRIVTASLINHEETNEIVRDASPEIIVHLAGWMERKRDVSIIDDMMNTHVTSVINILKSADPQITKLIINTGTSEEYGEQDDPFHEKLPIDPVSPYSATKGAGTVMASYLSRAVGIPVITMRPFIVYGPGQIHDTLIPFLIKGGIEKRNVNLTKGEQYRDFLYVHDLIRCYIMAMERMEKFSGHEIINVGSGIRTRVVDVVRKIADRLDCHDYFKIGAIPMRPGEPPSMIANINKASKMLDWKPNVSLEAGLTKTIDWWLENQKKNR